MNAENIEIVIDDISLTPANRKTPGITTCRQLIKNGDAEIADARYVWWTLLNLNAIQITYYNYHLYLNAKDFGV